MAATAAGVALKEPVILIVSRTKNEDIEKVRLVNSANIETIANPVWDKRSMKIIKASADDVELLLRCVLKFVQGMRDAGLSLDTGPKRFRQFRLCLDDRLQDE